MTTVYKIEHEDGLMKLYSSSREILGEREWEYVATDPFCKKLHDLAENMGWVEYGHHKQSK